MSLFLSITSFFPLNMLIFIYFDSTRSQPFVETKKISIMGRTISSKPDIICSRLDTGSDNPVIFVCKVCASFYNLGTPISVSNVFLTMIYACKCVLITCYCVVLKNNKNFATN